MIHDPKFWLAVSFIVFLLLILKFALPVILRMIDGKSIKISTLLQEAEEAKKKADQLLKDAQQYFDDSVKYGDKLIKDAAAESTKITQDHAAAVEAEIAKKLAVAEERIKFSEERAIREIKTKIVESAISAIEQNIDSIADEKALDQATKNSIDQIKTANQ